MEEFIDKMAQRQKKKKKVQADGGPSAAAPAPASAAAVAGALDAKTRGNAALQRGDPVEAIRCYTEGLTLDPASHILFSNRVAARIQTQEFDAAVHDATRCVELNAAWAKGMYLHDALMHFVCRVAPRIEGTVDARTRTRTHDAQHAHWCGAAAEAHCVVWNVVAQRVYWL